MSLTEIIYLLLSYVFYEVQGSLPKGTSTLRPLGDAMGTPPA